MTVTRRGRRLAVFLLAGAMSAAAGAVERRVAVISVEESVIHDNIMRGFRKQASFHADMFQDSAAFIRAVQKGGYAACLVVGRKSLRALPPSLSMPVVVTAVPNLFDDPLGEGAIRVHMDAPHKTQLALAKALNPAASSVGIIFQPGKSVSLVAHAKQALAESGYAIQLEPCEDASELTSALQRLAAAKIDILWGLMDPMLLSNPTLFQAASLFCLQNRIMLIVPAHPYVKAGAAMGVAADYDELGVLTARAVSDVLSQSSNQRDYFVERSVISINMKTLELLGLTLSDALKKKVRVIY